MKRLVLLLCALLPFSGMAATDDFGIHEERIGGFDVIAARDGTIVKVINGNVWAGFYDQVQAFHLINANIVDKDKLWQMVSFKREQYEHTNNGLLFGSALYLSQYNCKNKKVRMLQIIMYNEYWGRGRAVQRSDEVEQWNYPVPGTSGERLLKYACQILGNRKK